MRPMALCILAAVALASQARAQGLLESSDGQFGAFTVQGGSQLGVNFADKSMRLTVVRRVSTSRNIWGGHLKALASDGVLAIFEDSLKAIQWSGEAYYVRVLVDPRNSATYVTAAATIGYQYGREALADTGTTVARRRQVLRGVSGKLALTWFGGGGTSYLLDVAGTYGPQSNYQDLDELEVCTDIASQGAKSVRSCAPARLASAYRSSSRAALLIDGVVWPWASLPLALVGYGRYNTPRAQDRFVPALGVLFGKKGSPLSITGSLAVEFASSTRINARVGVPLGF